MTELNDSSIGYTQSGVIASIDGILQPILTPDTTLIRATDLDDIVLQQLQFVDENGGKHEIAVNQEGQLLVDDRVLFNLNNVHMNEERDSSPVLVAPNGTHYCLTVDNTGKLVTRKV